MPATGVISQVIGSTFEAEFPENELFPSFQRHPHRAGISTGIQVHLTGEVQQHLGGGRVRTPLRSGVNRRPGSRYEGSGHRLAGNRTRGHGNAWTGP